MKRKLLLGLVLFATVLFMSCSKNDSNTLNGTIWRCIINDEGSVETFVIVFQNKTYELTVTEVENGQEDSVVEKGTYVYSPPTIKIISGNKTESTTGTVNGNAMKINELTFTKQKM